MKLVLKIKQLILVCVSIFMGCAHISNVTDRSRLVSSSDDENQRYIKMEFDNEYYAKTNPVKVDFKNESAELNDVKRQITEIYNNQIVEDIQDYVKPAVNQKCLLETKSTKCDFSTSMSWGTTIWENEKPNFHQATDHWNTTGRIVAKVRLSMPSTENKLRYNRIRVATKKIWWNNFDHLKKITNIQLAEYKEQNKTEMIKNMNEVCGKKNYKNCQFIDEAYVFSCTRYPTVLGIVYAYAPYEQSACEITGLYSYED